MPKADPLAEAALAFCERIRTLTNSAEIAAAIEHQMAQFGFTHITCGDLPVPGRPPGTGLLMNTRPEEYTKRYLRKNYAPIDPALTEMQHTLRPYSWGDIRSFRKPEKRKLLIMDEAREFRMHDGLTIPIVTASGQVAAFCPAGECPDLHPRARAAVELMAVAGFQALRRAVLEEKRAEREKPLLTRRECEVMQWIAAGKTDDEIGVVLNLSRETVHVHVKNAMRKLNATRRPQAVYEAIRLGEIAI